MSTNLKYIFALLITLAALNTTAQNDEIGSGLKNHLFTGGSLGLAFGNETNIEVSPLFGYHLSNIVSVGIGGTYQYQHSRYYNSSLDVFGGRAFLRIQPLKPVFVHAEYQVLTYNTNIYNAPTYQNQQIVSEGLLVGVGYREYFSERLSSVIMLLYDLNYTIYSPYANPVFRFGIEYAIPLKN
ncbi:MAG: hypothetical protein A2W93_13545 [Bacteroidetes bacterium GWF2_43_63]|nr:MAG: hypothetical protein A2W94_03740 [Bacteroidetes bacterium GWE2_42_42]OFY55014.1 MAG: hypothetical protein A2W93_13545 [Bacteroidetes bacterium GWF2_43_63]HBG69549.1 hypothetical protein [Bacteroidales bacterium]HCB60712.1 hypothetical protein [Bacteroidales bacterium]HCY23984.1 hypothetical protein [Bacteroidales bacterium]